MTDIRISLAVCTRNRAKSLGHALDSLASQTARDRTAWEIVVIDNGSCDRTGEVIAAFSNRLPLSQIVEPGRGLARARNRAVVESRGEWLAFMDDDARADSSWLAELSRAIDTLPEMDYFAGRCLSSWPVRRPGWLRDPNTPFIQGLLCHYDLGPQNRPLGATDPVPFGVSMGFRRACLRSLGPFRVDLGAGTGYRGEDTELLERALGTGMRGWYLGRVLFRHSVDPKRFTPANLYRHGMAKGRTHALLDGNAPGSPANEFAHLARALAQGVLGRGDRMRVSIVNAGIERGLRNARHRREREDAA